MTHPVPHSPRLSIVPLLLTLAALAPSAPAQRVERLEPSPGQASQAQPVEAAARPPSLGLSLPAPRVAALPPLGPGDEPLPPARAGAPPVIGVHRSLPSGSLVVDSSGGRARTRVDGAWQPIPGGRVWRLGIASPGAGAMRVHFRDFAVGAGQVWLYSADGQVLAPYTGAGLYGDGEFWSDVVFGDSVTIEYLPDPAAAGEAVPFRIVEISHVWDDAFGPVDKAGLDRASVGAAVVSRPGPIDLVVEAPAAAGTGAKAATPLSPGSPVSFSLGPVDEPTLFAGDFSYRLEVPDGATRVTVTLESDDPAIDTDLHVRHGEDNAVVGGRVVSDHSSEGLTGNERIVITAASDPALRAGTYFISISLFDTGVEAEGTLTATVERDAPPDDSIGGGPLMSGQPAAFRLGPVAEPTLFAGDRSFRLEVPSAAERVVFRLRSVDPDVDVDLYVRYGQDNAEQNGRPVSDHASLGLTGDERIGITRRSDPPLRAGTYFVSIRLYDTDVVAEGNLTATVETDAADPHPDAACYPEWSNSAAGVARILFETGQGGTSFCTGTLLNNSREDRTPYFLTAAHCVSSQAEARSVTAFWNYQAPTCNADPPALDSVERTVGAHLLSTLGGGDQDSGGDMSLLRLEGAVPDDAVFQGWDATPRRVGAEVAGIHHPKSGEWGNFKRIAFGRLVSDTTFGVSPDTYAIVSWHPEQGYTEPGSSGSALFGSPGTVVGALRFGDIVDEDTVGPIRDAYTHFSVFYPQVSEFLDPTESAPGSFSITDLGGWSVASNGNAEALRTGYGRIRAAEDSTTPSGVAIFQYRDGDGVLISEAGVPAAEPVSGGRIFAEVNGSVTTGLAMANPNDAPATIDFHFTDAEGRRFAEGSFVLDAHAQIATLLNDAPFHSGAGILGTFTFTSSAPIAVIALRALTNEAGEFLMTTLPVARPSAAPDPSVPGAADPGTVYFPHFADGAGWATEVVLVNPTDRTITGTVEFLGPGSRTAAAAPVVLTLDDGSAGSEFDYAIAPGSFRRLTTANRLGDLKSGSVRATPDVGSAAPSGLVIFSYAPGGKTLAEAGVPITPQGRAFRVPVDARGTPNEPGSIRAGFAVTNTADDVFNTVTLEVTHHDGTPAAPPDVIVLPPSGQTAGMLDEVLTLPADFSGLLRVSAAFDVSVIALRFRVNALGELKATTTTPSNEAAEASSQDRFFAHWADSGGWTTEFVLYSGTAGQAASGTLSFYDAAGLSLDLTVPPGSTPPADGFAPADPAAFDSVFVGRQIAEDAFDYRLVFIGPGRVREVHDGESQEGNSLYARTGPDTGTLTYTYDASGNDSAVERSEIQLTFTSATTGSFVYTYTAAGSAPLRRDGSFELVDADSAGSCTNDLGTITGAVSRGGSWDGSCPSAHYRNGEYARYYTFTLGQQARVTIDLTSPSVDTWLALRNGAGTGTGLIESDDDGGSGGNARIVRTLAAGTYTIEATTFRGGATGPFTLRVDVSTGPASSP